MRGTISAWKFALGLGALTCLLPAPAGADVHLQFGTRWQPLRYTTAAFPTGTVNSPSDLKSPIGLSGFQTTSLDPYFAIFFAQRYGLQLSLDVGYGKLGSETQTGMNPVVPNNASFFQFGFALGFKFYITQPRREKVSPYIYADFYKYFASISADNATTENVSFAASLLSPIGATFAFGAEYFVTSNFSIGSEVLGLKVANVGAERIIMMGPTRTTVNYTYVTFYTGISFNYRFQVQTTMRANDEEGNGDEEAAPPRKRRKKVQVSEEAAAPPPPPPPPSPEAVD